MECALLEFGFLSLYYTAFCPACPSQNGAISPTPVPRCILEAHKLFGSVESQLERYLGPQTLESVE